MSKSIRCFDECKQQFIKNANNNRRNVEKQLFLIKKSKFNSRVEFNYENLSKENENRNNPEKNFEMKKILQVIVSKDRENLEMISTRKHREQRRSCFQKLNNKRFKQEIDIHRLIFEISHRITYSAKI
jgi:hypothetical protein